MGHAFLKSNCLQQIFSLCKNVQNAYWMVHIEGILPADSQQSYAPSELALVRSDRKGHLGREHCCTHHCNCLAGHTASTSTWFFDNFTNIGQIRHNVHIGELRRGWEGKKTCQSYLCPRYFLWDVKSTHHTYNTADLISMQVWLCFFLG